MNLPLGAPKSARTHTHHVGVLADSFGSEVEVDHEPHAVEDALRAARAQLASLKEDINVPGCHGAGPFRPALREQALLLEFKLCTRSCPRDPLLLSLSGAEEKNT